MALAAPSMSATSDSSVISRQSWDGGVFVSFRTSAMVVARLGPRELDGRDVDGEQEVAAGLLLAPGGDDAARLPEDPLADGDDQAGLLGQRDELGGGDHAALGVLPADQGLEADDPPVVEGDLRLEVDAELVALEGPVEVVLQRAAAQGAGPHGLVEDLDGAGGLALGRAAGRGGVAEAVLGRDVGGDDGDAAAGPAEHLAAGEHERRGEHVEQALGELAGAGLVGDRLAQDGEVARLDAGQHVARPEGGPEAGRGVGEQAVAGLVAEAVVDRLQAVEVDDEDGHGLAPGGRGPDGVEERHPGGEVGDRVVEDRRGPPRRRDRRERRRAGGHDDGPVVEVGDGHLDGLAAGLAHDREADRRLAGQAERAGVGVGRVPEGLVVGAADGGGAERAAVQERGGVGPGDGAVGVGHVDGDAEGVEDRARFD
jgi:hypothetical protein